MKTLIQIITVCMSLLIFQFSFAQEPQFAAPPTEPAMMDHQQVYAQQNNRQGRVKKVKARVKKDGVITAKERKKIKHAKNHKRAIHKKKNR